MVMDDIRAVLQFEDSDDDVDTLMLGGALTASLSDADLDRLKSAIRDKTIFKVGDLKSLQRLKLRAHEARENGVKEHAELLERKILDLI